MNADAPDSAAGRRGAGDLLRFFTPDLPAIATGLRADALADLVFLENAGERLTVLAPDGSTRLKALEAVSMSLDGLVYRLTLRKGLYFHCGAEVTASDAVETIARTLKDKNSFTQLHHFVSKDKAQRHGFAVYAVSRYRFELKLVHRMQDLLVRFALPELTLRHEGGACFNGLWKVVEQDSEGLLLAVNPRHAAALTAPYREIRWERLAKDPELKSADGEAFVYVYAGTQLKSPPEEVLADEILRPLPAGLSFLIELDGPTGVCAEVKNRIVRATRARFTRNSLWRRAPLTTITPKGHILSSPFPEPQADALAGQRRYRLELTLAPDQGIVPARIWAEFQKIAGAEYGLDVGIAGSDAAVAADARGLVRMVYHGHPADYFTPIALLAAGRYDLGSPGDQSRSGQLPRAYADFCQSLTRSARVAPFLSVPFILRSNRNVRSDETTGLLYFADVRQSEGRLRKLRMKDATLKALGSALQMFVHDVKRPFSMVQGILSLLESAQSPERLADLASRYLPDVRKAVGSVDRLIEDILEIGSDSEPNCEHVAVADLISSVLRELFAFDKPKDLIFSGDFDHEHKLHADPRKLARVISNIVANAAEAMKREGKIWFSTREDDEKSLITVTIGNTNSYIPPEMIGGIFDRFFTEGKKKGTGLGLAIVKKIVVDHGGDVWCVSDRVDGTRFHFTIPAAREIDAPAPISFDAPAPPAPDLRGRSAAAEAFVLLVEDDPLYVEVIQSLLAGAGASASACFSARNADEAFAMARERRFGIAIVDVDLGPESEDGLALVRRLRALDPALRICVHSDGAPFELQRLVVEAGGDLFLPKPMAREHLHRLLKASPRAALPRAAVVDDDALMLEAWEAMPGYEWRAFESPEAFLAACDADEALLPSLRFLVTDQTFAGRGQTGSELAAALQARRPSLPLFIASSLRAIPPSAGIRAVVSKDPAAGLFEIERLLLKSP